MGRIRTIKPEFPQSESMGRVSRDARLLFIQLWTLCDDEGRTRADSRMIARLLYPYDDGEEGHFKTSTKDVDAWFAELEREQCVFRYQSEGTTYAQIAKWLNHQKIDRPSKSKIPEFDESSRIISNPLDYSTTDLDQGSRIKEGKGRERKGEENPLVEPDGATSSARAVFEYWQKIMLKPRTVLDGKRSRAINGRLKDGYSVETLCRAVDGCRADPFSMGQNDRNTPYNDIELICRDSTKVDRFLVIADRPVNGHDPRMQAIIESNMNWTPKS